MFALLAKQKKWDADRTDRMDKDQAIEFLWPEANLTSGANNLYRTLYTLRQTLRVDAALRPGRPAL